MHGTGLAHLEAEGDLGSWKFCIKKNKGGGDDNRFIGGYFMIFFSSWNSSHAPAVSDLTKPADITITDDTKDDHLYEEVT